MHPTVVLSIWLLVVLLIQGLSSLWVLALAGLSLPFLSTPTRRRFGELLVRSRWILLTLLLTFLLLTPGERLIPGLPASQEGMLLALEHLTRLLAVLLAVAWLVGGHPVEWLTAALRGALVTLRLSNADRVIVRLVLVLECAAAGKGTDWRARLLETDLAGDSSIELPITELSVREQAIAGGILIGGLLMFALLS